MKKSKTFIIISIGIVLITTLSIFRSLHLFDSNTFLAKNGVLSLQKWDSTKESIVELNGEWDFYPNELIVPSPNKDVFENYRSIHKLIHVPEDWNNYISKDTTPYGVGTYRLLIHVPKNDHYGIKLNTIRDASKVYINGVELGSAGVPSEKKQDYRFDFKKYVLLENSSDRTLDIVIQVANQEYARGGIVNSIEFGKADQILAQKERERFIQALLIAGYLLFSLIYLAVHFQNKKRNRYEVYFSLYCLSEGVYVSTVNERWIYLLFPEITPTVQVEIQMFVHSLSIIFFLLFIYHFFNSFANKKVVTLLSTMMALQAFSLLVFCTIHDIFQYIPFQSVQIVVSLTTSVSYIYIFTILVKASLQKTDESKYVLISVISFLAYVFLLAMQLLYEIEIESSSLVLFLIMAMSLSLLMNYRSQLAFHKVEELSEELLVYDKLKDEFLAKTSHELSTPLHVILNLSQSLMEGTEGPLKKQQQESVILIHNVGRRLASLVNDLLFIAKIKKGEISIVPRPISIYIVEDVLAEMAYLIPSTQPVKLVNNIPRNLPLVYTDEQKLKQVFFNLIHNAIKFTKKGTITISAKVRDEQMIVSVEDTGRGITKEHYDFIFSTFYQEESSKSGNAKGLGLGLSITKQIVEETGGRIWVASEVGKGSCFTFTIPIANELQLLEPTETESNKKSEPIISSPIREQEKQVLSKKISGTKPYTILVVDDEPANLKVLINMIQSLEYSVIAVGSGEEALEIVKTEKVDLMILDLMMPNMTGYEVCKTVRKEYDLVELPVIILTAASQIYDLVLSFQLGANDYLQKPVNMEELKVRIESLLSIKKSALDAVNNELSRFSSQITPHFLYNTLNTIIGLSYKDQEKTREALDYLATYFRAKLDVRKQRSLVSLVDEVELVQAYLAIEQMRFGERLNIVYNIDEAIETYIPTMTIQPLVENAVQHGISKNPDGGTLRLIIEREQKNVKIIIQDNGVGIPQEKQQELLSGKNERLGFTNPFNKLSLIKGASFRLDSEEGKGTEITIRIPEIKDKESTIY
ncbi:ATP-binding protein [Rummeliibacillus pycnus]|uniref:hybrid sensor histidine kinase/response regulator n=1 Tax=Rummeliibacillus pycnus TaxID=101070 RepID=UPI0037C6DCC8